MVYNDGKLLVFGGFNPDEALANNYYTDAWSFDLTSQIWEDISASHSSYPSAFSSSSTYLSDREFLFKFGGFKDDDISTPASLE
mmetsp:Transcript_401/g.378  ORF Transcript_401/g.378 Transcript_401/m.378 type:complete len:84 (-) Transcript_401:883-1134(-)|eukprot:CAMPEP_0114591676 /NCGR_PEP_ID=MMETSP0125-20121206/13668_1 /TAXON_ID=485358 ORGANISM="Aristerostoma sp., Strain ATCC 50986" /NCGR_SAMPLE_ID=MMETSP0125 /ASSEMBLY_ACC=CAM_ASM_000245 /LENGTH=83 /DNA_ID=CAMNT_0001789889 /DNA_START=803 /DNA_END=1054 /DNA_ORIENTATION=+